MLAHPELGLVPWSLQSTGLDCDQGEPELLLLFAPPYAALASRREAGQHFYYRDTKPRDNRKFRLRGVFGEVRCACGIR